MKSELLWQRTKKKKRLSSCLFFDSKEIEHPRRDNTRTSVSGQTKEDTGIILVSFFYWVTVNFGLDEIHSIIKTKRLME